MPGSFFSCRNTCRFRKKENRPAAWAFLHARGKRKMNTNLLQVPERLNPEGQREAGGRGRPYIGPIPRCRKQTTEKGAPIKYVRKILEISDRPSPSSAFSVCCLSARLGYFWTPSSPLEADVLDGCCPQTNPHPHPPSRASSALNICHAP